MSHAHDGPESARDLVAADSPWTSDLTLTRLNSAEETQGQQPSAPEPDYLNVTNPYVTGTASELGEGDGTQTIVPGDGTQPIVSGDGTQPIVPGDGTQTYTPTGDGTQIILPTDPTLDTQTNLPATDRQPDTGLTVSPETELDLKDMGWNQYWEALDDVLVALPADWTEDLAPPAVPEGEVQPGVPAVPQTELDPNAQTVPQTNFDPNAQIVPQSEQIVPQSEQIVPAPALEQGTEVAPTTAPQDARRDPNTFFITQYQSQFNPNGPASSNDCGPASLAMAAIAFGKVPPDVEPGNPQSLVDRARQEMTGSVDREALTGIGQMRTGLDKLGMQHEDVQGIDAIDTALEQNKMVIASGNPICYERAKGLDGTTYGNSGKYDGGHWILVVGKVGDEYIINDPLSRVGSMTISRDLLEKYIQGTGGNNGGIATWA